MPDPAHNPTAPDMASPEPAAPLERALSVQQLAKRWSVRPRRVRDMIRRGLVDAFDVGDRRPKLRIAPEAVAAAEKRLKVSPRGVQRERPPAGVDPDVAKLLEE